MIFSDFSLGINEVAGDRRPRNIHSNFNIKYGFLILHANHMCVDAQWDLSQLVSVASGLNMKDRLNQLYRCFAETPGLRQLKWENMYLIAWEGSHKGRIAFPSRYKFIYLTCSRAYCQTLSAAEFYAMLRVLLNIIHFSIWAITSYCMRTIKKMIIT